VGQGTITTIAPADMIQCAIDCSTYCSVLLVNSERAGSACEKQADSPILSRWAAGNAEARRVGGAPEKGGRSGMRNF